MVKKFGKGAAATLLLFSTASLSAPVVASANSTFTMTVFHTNDTHAHLDTTAERAALVKKLRTEKPHHVLVDAGDVFSGTLFFNEFQGQADLAIMNYLEYDAMTFGNHEFDTGSSSVGHKALVDFIKGAAFPFVSTNVNFSGDSLFDGLQSRTISDEPQNGHIYNGIIKEVNGEKIGIFGLTTEETASISSPNQITFSHYITEAKETVAAFQEHGINKIIAVTHIGFDDSNLIDNDKLLAENVPGIDIIVGGHTHSKIEPPHVIQSNGAPVVIVQANEYNKFLGQLDVTFDENGIITDYDGVLHQVGGEGAEKDPEAEELIRPYLEQVEAKKKAKTGAIAAVQLNGTRNFRGVRMSETNLGNVITDGMLTKAKEIDPETVIAFQNGGGIRTSIPKGDITYGQVLTVLPFNNPLAIIELTGAELKETFEHAYTQFPKESGGFLHVSGMQVVFDGKAEPGKRIVSMTINGKEIDESRTYKAATNVFTARGGDGFEALGEAYKAGRATEPGFSDWENFANHLQSLQTVNPSLEGRVLAKTPFTDLRYSDWAYPYVSDLFYQQLTKGTTATTYSPKMALTRSQAASLLVRALDLTATTDAPFPDVSHLNGETKAEIAAAAEAGIVKGSNGKFAPGEPVTRAQLALMIHRAIEHYTGESWTPTEQATFTDLQHADAEAIQAISILHELSIATGSNNQFMPANSTSREQAAKIVSNLLLEQKSMKKAE